MRNLKYLVSVGVVGLAAGLASTPAFASEGEEEAVTIEATEIVAEARGNFTGFRLDRPMDIVAAQTPLSVPDFASEDGAANTRFISTTDMQFAISRNIDGLPGPADPELIVRDDIGVAGAVDVNNTLPSVVQLFRQNNASGGVSFNCTGTLINPRTVLTAAHCLNSVGSETYGTPESGAESAILVATGVDTSTRIFTYIGNGANYAAGGVATSTDVVIHPSANLENAGLPFPWADVAFVALDAPITDVPAMPILLTPLDSLTHVVITGYGTTGTGETGSQGIGFLRRVGENMLGAVASSGDLIDTIFPGFAPSIDTLGFESQALYFIDFDDPRREAPGEDACGFSGFGISCPDLDTVLAIDWFDGDALEAEAGTAPGDSGSPIIVDEQYAFPVIAGVLSGGFDFFGTGNRYGDISFYNPLYPFFEFITENTPYKYVSANEGDGLWSDPTRWTQDFDPGFFIDDGTGTLVNGIPEGNEPGVTETGPKLGLILGQDISGNSDALSPIIDGLDTSVPESSVLLGPGSTGFVPQNTDGTPGVAFANPAQYFDVILNRAGTTTVDLDVEIDRLTLANNDAGLNVAAPWTLTSLIGVEQAAGIATVDGTVETPIYALFGGLLQGSGTIVSDAVFNIAGGVAPGGLDAIDTLSIDGQYIQTSQGALVIDGWFRGRRTFNDVLEVSGDASLAGDLIVSVYRGQASFGQEIAVLEANSILGGFENTVLITRSPVLFASSRVEGNQVIVEIGARRLKDLLNADSSLGSLAGSIDSLRFGGRYAEFAGMFDVIDSAGISTLLPTLGSLTPTSAFGQTMVANSFSQRFTGQIGQRTLALRGANKAAAGFSAGGSTGSAIAGTEPATAGKLGFFSTVSGAYLTGAAQRGTGANALEEAAFTRAGELTMGADMAVSDDISFGFAVTNIRNSGAQTGVFQRPDDTSTAVAVFGAAQFGAGFADAYAGVATQELGAERASLGDFASEYGFAQGASDARQTFAGARVGYAMDVAPGLEMGPVASVDYVRSDIGSFEEFGAGAFGLAIHGRSYTSVGTKLGLMGALDTQIGRTSKLTAFGSVAYARELADSEDVVTANFIGAEDVPFSIANAIDPEWVSVNAGAELSLQDNFSLSVTATSDMGRGILTNNEGRVSLNWRF